MRSLVTGGHGFVGSHLVRRLLADGAIVRCLSRRPGVPASLRGLEVEIVPGDLRDEAALARAVEGVDEVFHLAALTRSRTRAAMRRTNLGATVALARRARAAGLPGRFVFCSSLAAVGPAPPGRVVDEGTPPRPVTWYGESKRDAERALAALGGLDVAILRPPAVYGPRDRDFLAMFQAAGRGLEVLVGDPGRPWSFVYAEDLAEALLVAARHPAAGGSTFFVTHEEPLSTAAFARHVARAVGARRRLRVGLPLAAAGLAARLADLATQLTGRVGLLNGQRLRELSAGPYVCTAAAFREATGFEATTDAAEGTRRTAAFYREAGWLPGAPPRAATAR